MLTIMVSSSLTEYYLLTTFNDFNLSWEYTFEITLERLLIFNYRN